MYEAKKNIILTMKQTSSDCDSDCWLIGEAFERRVKPKSFWNKFNPVRVIFSAFSSGI